MQKDEAKAVIIYYGQIPGMEKLLFSDKKVLSDEYSGMKAINYTGMPHGSGVGRPTEELGIKAAEKDYGNRLKEIEIKLDVLMSDAEHIRSCLDAMCGKYKQILICRYSFGYSWRKISAKMETPESTLRLWEQKALSTLGDNLENVTMCDEILNRAKMAL